MNKVRSGCLHLLGGHRRLEAVNDVAKKSSSVTSDDGDVGRCPVCKESYRIAGADEIRLPCSHSVCRRCLPSLSRPRTADGRGKSRRRSQCPVCKKKFHATPPSSSSNGDARSETSPPPGVPSSPQTLDAIRGRGRPLESVDEEGSPHCVSVDSGLDRCGREEFGRKEDGDEVLACTTDPTTTEWSITAPKSSPSSTVDVCSETERRPTANGSAERRPTANGSGENMTVSSM